MSNKRFNDQNPASKDGADSSKEGMRGMPAKSGAGPFKPAGGKVPPFGLKAKGGKDLPAVKLDEYKSRSDEATGELP